MLSYKADGRWHSQEIMARQGMGTERIVSYSEIITSNGGCVCQRSTKPEP